MSLSVANLLGGGDFGIIEDIVLALSQTNRPVVTSFHRSLVDYCTEQSVVVFAEALDLVVLYWIAVFHFLVVDCLESVQMDYQ